MNVWTFTGNVGNDAEIRATQAGTQITNYSVAVTSGFGDKQVTTWVRCNHWGDRGAKVAPYILKGGKVAVSGEVSLREWEKDGVTRTSLEVRVNDVTLLGSKADSTPASHTPPSTPQPTDDFLVDDLIPF